jgi:tripartite-type tricarboxylate transporter receptor subunit TctC
MRMRMIVASLAGLLVAISIKSSPADAQETYPSRPVRIVLPVPAGAAPDVRTRIIAHQLTITWGKQVVIENRPGAGGALGVQAALSPPADGYTLLSLFASVFTVLPAQRDKLPFDVNRDLVPVAMISNEGMVFAVSPKLGVNNLAEFIALAKAQPDKLLIGTNPAGSLPHLAVRLFVKLTKAPITVVPYSTGGTNEAIREILGGRVHGVIEGRPGLKAHLDNGDLKALAIMSRERVTSFPDLPTAAENRSGSDGDWLGWYLCTEGSARRHRSTAGREYPRCHDNSGGQDSVRANRLALSAAVHRRFRPLHRGRAEALVAGREGGRASLSSFSALGRQPISAKI